MPRLTPNLGLSISEYGDDRVDKNFELLDVAVAGGGGSVPNVKYLSNYSSYKVGSSWNGAFSQAFTELTALGGGTLKIPIGTHEINALITIPSNIQVEGYGAGVSIIKLAAGVSSDMITLDTNDNCGISHVTIWGNIDGVASAPTDRYGLILGRPGINTTNNEGEMGNINIHNIEIRSIGGTGFYCYPGTWIYYLSKFRIRFCTGYGAHIGSTDNMYDSFDLTANGKAGLYVTGSNNRFSNMKIIFNGRGPYTAGKFYGNGTDLNSAGVYCGNGTRNTFVNIESQENYGHGFVFDGAKDADIVGCLADKNGYTALAPDGTSVTGTVSAIGFYFFNSAARLTGMIKATNFNTGLVSQRIGYYVDSTCSNVSLDYEQDATQTGLSVNLSFTSVVTSADTKALALALAQYDDLFVSGQTFNNLITAYNTSVFSLGATFVTAGYTISGNEIYGSTNWAGTPRMGTVGNASTAAVQDNIYLLRVRLKPDINNYFLRTKLIYNDGAFENLTQIDGNYSNAAFTDVSFVIKAPRVGNLMLMVEDKVGANNAVQGAFRISEVAIINITAAITAKYYPKTIDLLVKKNYFLGSRTFV